METVIGAVTVFYNPNETDILNILSYRDLVDYMIVIDNSPQSNIEKIKSILGADDDRITIKKFSENIGLCKALNFGIHYLYQLGCDWVLTMDSDSYFHTNIVAVYRSYILNYDTSRVACLVPQFLFGRRKITEYEGYRKKKWAMQSGTAVNVSVFKRLGGFKEEFFVDGLDVEYGLRAHRYGYNVVECGKAILTHFPAQTKICKLFGKEIFKYGYAPPIRYYYQARADCWMIKKYRSGFALVDYLIRLGKITLLFDNKKDFYAYFFKGTKEGFFMK